MLDKDECGLLFTSKWAVGFSSCQSGSSIFAVLQQGCWRLEGVQSLVALMMYKLVMETSEFTVHFLTAFLTPENQGASSFVFHSAQSSKCFTVEWPQANLPEQRSDCAGFPVFVTFIGNLLTASLYVSVFIYTFLFFVFREGCLL